MCLSAVYGRMPTPNSPIAQTDDIHADPAFASQFDANVGETAQNATSGVPFTQSIRSALDRLPCNVGRTDQMIRLSVGAALVTAAATAPVSRGWRIAMAAVGAAELITGVLRYCPVSQAFGVNTCRGDER